MGNEREGKDQKSSKVLSLDDLESGGAIDRKTGVKRKSRHGGKEMDSRMKYNSFEHFAIKRSRKLRR